MGKIDIDYQILHDAFFRYQTKPAMTSHGELYYEGREHEQKMTDKRPCVYSPALREALGMKKDDPLAPPPWLINMQRFGPPPAYPHLRIPGVSAPIPFGARYGFGEGEWGKPPVDANGRPLYGDVFGVEARANSAQEEKIDTTRWGAMESEGEEDEEEEEEEEEPVPEEEEGKDEGMDLSGGTSSTMSGLTTPEVLNLRKADGTGTETPDTVRRAPQQLYQVLEEKKIGVGGAMFGTSHTYVLPDAAAAASGSAQTEQERKVEALRARARGQVDVNLAPEELEGLDAAGLKRKYEAQLSAEQAGKKAARTAVTADQDEDDEDEEEGGRKKKRKKAGAAAAERNKVYKDFKF
jgi:splicing factor 3B subunit 2